jgi:hypothetical protein
MIGGTFLLAVGLIGSALQKNVQMASGPSSSESDKTTAQHTPANPPSATIVS